jgi:hypothetical protein
VCLRPVNIILKLTKNFNTSAVFAPSSFFSFRFVLRKVKHGHKYRKGIILNCDQKSIILLCSGKKGPPCYSIETGEILWRGNVFIPAQAFSYKGAIY